MEKLYINEVDGKLFFHRIGKSEPGSDEQAFEEVVERKAYRRFRDKFDVFPGEHWLDLGANVGAFAFYCRLRNATASCYEPMPDCFRILKKNVPASLRKARVEGRSFELFNAAVTAMEQPKIQFFASRNPDNHYRGTIVHVERYAAQKPVDNICGSFLRNHKYDGVKMDIEGSEFGLIDNWFLPETNKLVMEYHTSRDSSVANLEQRLKILKDHFKQVRYPVAYDTAIERWKADGTKHDSRFANYRPRFDQLIFCWEPR